MKNSTHPASLADPDSRFIAVNGLRVHYKTAGQGQPYIILLHGFGASAFSWREVIEPLGKLGTVIAYDRPAFGLTERPMQWRGPNPYSVTAQANLLLGLMDQMGIERAILVGNSAGGGVAALAAVEHPERVQALVLVDPALGAAGPASPVLRWLLNTPQLAHVGRLIARKLEVRGDDLIRASWHDPSKITPSIMEGYHRPLQVENWDRALWNLTKAPQPTNLLERVKGLTVPVLVLTGDDDRIVPTAHTIQLAGTIPGSELVVFNDCGHVSQEECPQLFIDAFQKFIQRETDASVTEVDKGARL